MNNLETTFESILNDISNRQYSGIKKETINPNKDDLFSYKNQSQQNEMNEIYCIYKKNRKTINLMYDYKNDNLYYRSDFTERQKTFEETKKLINANNIELYVNQRKIKFNFIYESDEKGDIKIKFKFKPLLTSTSQMFYKCYYLKSIDLSSFNFSKVNDMSLMFYDCSSLESFNLISKDIRKIEYLNEMFDNCKELKTVNFKTSSLYNLIYLDSMFYNCSSLESLDLSSFETNSISSMSHMFYNCSSLKELDLSSIDTINVNSIEHIFHNFTSLKKENVKLNKKGKRIKAKLDSYSIY